MIDAVHRYDGYIVQSTGDGIFALFGAPVAHEDHPQRALYAALRMQEELRRYAERLRAEGGTPLQARVGVNTGEVVVRSIQTGDGHAEYTPIGHSTGLAARMQALAPIRLDRRRAKPTRKLVRRLLSASSRWDRPRSRASASRSNCFRGDRAGTVAHAACRCAARRGLTKFVGRQAELEQMKRALELGRARATARSSRRWASRESASRACSSSSRRCRSRDAWCWRPTRSPTARPRPTCR